MWLLYQIAIALTLVLAGPFLLLRRGRHYLESLPARLGRHRGPVVRSALWIHAVSVGEVGVAATLAGRLPRDLPLLVTTITPTGQERARNAFGNRGTVTYLPFDLGFAIERFLRRFGPRALILVEGDLWPLLLARARRRRIPVAVVNGRIGDRSFRRMRRCRPFLGPLLGPVDRFGVQSDMDRERLIELGVDPDRVVVTGNLKFDTPAPRANPELAALVRELADRRPVLVAGSTMQGEEQAVLDAFERLGAGGSALMVLAPRHPERWNDVERLAEERGLEVLRRSRLERASGRPDILLLDTLGELAALYGVGLGCFIGGTLVPTGGHNPLEAARHGVAIAAGPSMENFREIAAAFERGGAWRRVADADELAETWGSWLRDPQSAAELGSRGAAVVSANQGALPATVDLLGPILGAFERSASLSSRGDR